ncbi:hypothetical protein [Methylomonas sp. AM2-LC]|uniref:hypothetical protein n=1 Tax=Methylomonas sp. AM2-LC TaxID=3153301 RepID=UPI0032650E07
MTDDNLQNQTQSQSLLVNIQNASDPAFERKIFAEVASEGQQLGSISDVVGILLNTYEKSVSIADPSITKTIQQFRDIQQQIANKKKERSAQQVIDALETMRSEDNETYLLVAASLRKWLDDHPDVSNDSKK